MSRTDVLCWFCKRNCSGTKDFSCDRCRKCFHSDCHLQHQQRNSRSGDQPINDIFPLINGPVPPDYLCPVCKFLAYANDIVYDKKYLHDMNRAMVHVVNHLKQMDDNSLFWSPVKLPGYDSYVLSPKCLSEILRDAEKESYHSVAAFEADLRLIFHNSNVFNGSSEKAPITMEAKNIMDEGVKHCQKIRYCSKCYWLNFEYDNLNLKGDFLKPCERPHGVVWTKNDKDEYSLAKIIGFHVEKRFNKLVEVCFFETRKVETVKMEECFVYCQIGAFLEFCKNQTPPLKISVTKKVEQDVQKYFENAKTIFKNDAPRFKLRQENKTVTYLDEKHLYLIEFVTEWDFTNESQDKDDRKNRLNRPESFTQFFNEVKPPKEPRMDTIQKSSKEHTPRVMRPSETFSNKNASTSKAEKSPRVESGSSKSAPSASKIQRLNAVKDDVATRMLIEDFRDSHNAFLKKRTIYFNRIEAFDKARKKFNNAEGLYVPAADSIDNDNNAPGLQPGEDLLANVYNKHVTINSILKMKQPLIDDVQQMISNNERLFQILDKYPENQASSSINSWRGVIKNLSEATLSGTRSLIKEVVHKEKIPDLWKKCVFYHNVRNYEPADRREVCDNCYDPAQFYRPIGNKYATFCQQKCAKDYLDKISSDNDDDDDDHEDDDDDTDEDDDENDDDDEDTDE